MDRIARLADVSKPMLYALFDSKEGLYAAYVQRSGAALIEQLTGASAADPPLRLRSVVDGFLSFVEQHPDGWTVLYCEIATQRRAAGRVTDVHRRIVTEVTRTFEAEGPDGRPGMAAPASEAIAEAIVGAGEALANWWLTRSDVARDDLTDWYVGLTRAAASAIVASTAS